MKKINIIYLLSYGILIKETAVRLTHSRIHA